MLRKQDCVKFRGRIAWQTFFENNFADFSDVVRVKKSRFRPAVGGVSNKQHLLFTEYYQEVGATPSTGFAHHMTDSSVWGCNALK